MIITITLDQFRDILLKMGCTIEDHVLYPECECIDGTLVILPDNRGIEVYGRFSDGDFDFNNFIREL